MGISQTRILFCHSITWKMVPTREWERMFFFHVEVLHPELSSSCLDQHVRSVWVLLIHWVIKMGGGWFALFTHLLGCMGLFCRKRLSSSHWPCLFWVIPLNAQASTHILSWVFFWASLAMYSTVLELVPQFPQCWHHNCLNSWISTLTALTSLSTLETCSFFKA